VYELLNNVHVYVLNAVNKGIFGWPSALYLELYVFQCCKGCALPCRPGRCGHVYCTLCREERRDTMSMGDVAVCSAVVTVHGVLCTMRGVQRCTLWRVCEP
jgi:hypothetical protein